MCVCVHVMRVCLPKGHRPPPPPPPPLAITCCSPILGHLTIPYCPVPADSALLTGQQGYESYAVTGGGGGGYQGENIHWVLSLLHFLSASVVFSDATLVLVTGISTLDRRLGNFVLI